MENLSTLGHRITNLPNVSVSGPRQNFGEHFPCLDQGRIFATFFHLWMRTALAGADDGGPRMTLVPQTLLLSSQVTFLSMNRSNQVSAFFSLWTRSKVFVINSGVQGLGT